MALSDLPVFANYRDRLLHLREENLKQQADRERWRAADVREFAAEHETDPRTDRDLYRIVLKRVGDVKRDVEESDLGWRYELAAEVPEWRLRTWLASKLLVRSRQRYTVPQESVIDQNERPDIRIEQPRAGVASLEMKWAQDWSFNALMEALEVQLLGQYLRAHNSRHGVLVLGMHQGGNRHWLPGDGRHLDFPALVAALKAKAGDVDGNHGRNPARRRRGAPLRIEFALGQALSDAPPEPGTQGFIQPFQHRSRTAAAIFALVEKPLEIGDGVGGGRSRTEKARASSPALIRGRVKAVGAHVESAAVSEQQSPGLTVAQFHPARPGARGWVCSVRRRSASARPSACRRQPY
ncbi:MAG: hypothetical protein HY736_14285 [Verrucomicrobia bacterium]|nr:hypothetical protein [Verrucomicrobiota bacterium]